MLVFARIKGPGLRAELSAHSWAPGAAGPGAAEGQARACPCHFPLGPGPENQLGKSLFLAIPGQMAASSGRPPSPPSSEPPQPPQLQVAPESPQKPTEELQLWSWDPRCLRSLHREGPLLLGSATGSAPAFRKIPPITEDREHIQSPPRHGGGRVWEPGGPAVRGDLALPGSRWLRLPRGGDI